MIASSRDVHVTAWCLGMGIDLPELYKVLVDRFGEDKVTVFPTAPDHVHPAQVSREFSGDLEPMQSSREQADFEAKQEAVDQANIIHLYYSDPNGHLRGEAVYAEVWLFSSAHMSLQYSQSQRLYCAVLNSHGCRMSSERWQLFVPVLLKHY